MKTELDTQAYKVIKLETQSAEVEKRLEELKTQAKNADELRLKEVAEARDEQKLQLAKADELRLKEVTELRDNLQIQLMKSTELRQNEVSEVRDDLKLQLLKTEELRENQVCELRNELRTQEATADKLLQDSLTETRASAAVDVANAFEERVRLDAELAKAREEIESARKNYENNRIEETQLRERLSARETEEARLGEEIRSLRATNDVLSRQLELKETEKAANDSHFHKAMDTFQQTQYFLHEQASSLNSDKAKIEARMDVLASAKANLDLENARIETSLKESQDIAKKLPALTLAGC
jgi:hypothetical protein